MRKYTIVLLPDSEEQAFTVLVPELPGCITQGETVDEALANAREAIEGHLEALAATGQEIPEEVAPPFLASVEVNPDLSAIKSSSH